MEGGLSQRCSECRDFNPRDETPGTNRPAGPHERRSEEVAGTSQQQEHRPRARAWDTRAGSASRAASPPRWILVAPSLYPSTLIEAATHINGVCKCAWITNESRTIANHSGCGKSGEMRQEDFPVFPIYLITPDFPPRCVML